MGGHGDVAVPPVDAGALPGAELLRAVLPDAMLEEACCCPALWSMALFPERGGLASCGLTGRLGVGGLRDALVDGRLRGR